MSDDLRRGRLGGAVSGLCGRTLRAAVRSVPGQPGTAHVRLERPASPVFTGEGHHPTGYPSAVQPGGAGTGRGGSAWLPSPRPSPGGRGSGFGSPGGARAGVLPDGAGFLFASQGGPEPQHAEADGWDRCGPGQAQAGRCRAGGAGGGADRRRPRPGGGGAGDRRVPPHAVRAGDHGGGDQVVPGRRDRGHPGAGGGAAGDRPGPAPARGAGGGRERDRQDDDDRQARAAGTSRRGCGRSWWPGTPSARRPWSSCRSGGSAPAHRW